MHYDDTMPIYEYQAKDPAHSCPHCAEGFEELRPLSAPPLTTCPRCGAPVTKQISAPAIGGSESGFDDRAKSKGFHKLKRLGHGEYEKQY